MIKLTSNLPDNVVSLVGSGQVDAKDYQNVLVPAIEAALAKHDKVRVLYQLGEDFAGFTTGAMWEDTKLGLGHLAAWEKVAVVTDVHWIAEATRFLGFAIPCPVKVFALKDLPAAEAWIVD